MYTPTLLYSPLILLFLISGCYPDGGDSSVATDDTLSTIPGDGVLFKPCAKNQRLGGFEATVLQEYSGIQGEVSNGVIPGAIPTNELEEGGCTLWKKQILACDPPCVGSETCGFDGACIRAPTNQDLGTVTVDGLKKKIEMEPREPGKNYFDTTVPHPVFDANNAVIRLSTTDGYLGAISLFGAGSNAIVPAASEWEIVPGEDLTIRWDAPSSDSKTAVVIYLAIDQHGSTPVTLECVFNDNGEGVVPATVIDSLISAGVTGFPTAKIKRTTTDSLRVAGGCVEFVVQSYTTIDVRVSGYIPCSDTETCPEGLECNTVTYLCE